MTTSLLNRLDVPDGGDDLAQLTVLRALLMSPDLVADLGDRRFPDSDITYVFAVMEALNSVNITPTLVQLERSLRGKPALLNALHRQRQFAFSFMSLDKEVLRKTVAELSDMKLHEYRRGIIEKLKTLGPNDVGTSNLLLYQLQHGRP